jgi:glycosyltransferase involved in cell wall biosynthesis
MGDAGFEMEGIDVELIPWSKNTEADVIRSFDIGLYPLPDEEWIKGKSGLKSLMYMACGVPSVASAVGTNLRVMDHGVHGFFAKTEDDWIEYLKKLLLDENLRREFGTKGAEHVEKHFSINANKATYLRVINNVHAGEKK